MVASVQLVGGESPICKYCNKKIDKGEMLYLALDGDKIYVVHSSCHNKIMEKNE